MKGHLKWEKYEHVHILVSMIWLRITGCVYRREEAYTLLRSRKMIEMEEEMKELIGLE